MGGKALAFKLRAIAETVAGTDDSDAIREISKSLSSLIRTRTKWLVKAGHANLKEVHIPAAIPGPHVTLTDVATLTSDDLSGLMSPDDIEKVEVLFPSKVSDV